MANKTYYKLYKTSESQYLMDIGISSYEIKEREFGKMELGRGLRIFSKKYSTEDFGPNDIITLKWNILPENSRSFEKIYSLKNGDMVNFIASGNFNLNISAEVINISYQYIQNILLKNDTRAREVAIQLSIITKS